MSTKIYNAYKVDSNISLYELVNLFKKFKSEYKKSIINNIVNQFKNGEFSTVLNVIDLSNELKKSYKSDLNLDTNYGASVVLYTIESNLYVQFFGLYTYETFSTQSLIDQIFVNESGSSILTDYHYQNQSDPYFCHEDKEYSSEELIELEIEWDKRKEIWDEIFDDEHPNPSSAGLSYDLYTESDIWMISISTFNQIQSVS